MKKTFNFLIVIIILSGCLLNGCSDFLDKQPISQLSRDKFWKTPKDADIWIAAMYDCLQMTLRTNYFIWGEVRSDNQQLAGTGTAQLKFLSNTLTSDMTECNWNNLYRTISSANFAIKYIPAIPDVAAPQIAAQLGQAYTMRALMYFYAIRIWGAVPLITEPYEGLAGQEKFNSRSEVTVIKDQILSDINKALANFDVNITSIYQLNRGSALALQTDVYMWFKDYANAIIASDNLIALKKYSLVTKEADWKKIFVDPATSTETIFNMFWDYLQDGGGNGLASFYGSGSNTPQYKIRQPLWDTLVSRRTDARFWNLSDTLNLYYMGGKVKVSYEAYNLNSTMYSSKFAPWDPAKPNTTYNYVGGYTYPPNNECSVHIPIYRYSDIMLLRAEALNKVGRGAEAMTIANTIRSRMGYMQTLNSSNTPTQSALEDAILIERQLEFWGEGKRWYDLMRTGKVVTIMDPILKARGIAEGFGDVGKILFPIHSSAFEGNPLIKQNPPYTQN
jgi:hypothetical protein